MVQDCAKLKPPHPEVRSPCGASKEVGRSAQLSKHLIMLFGNVSPVTGEPIIPWIDSLSNECLKIVEALEAATKR